MREVRKMKKQVSFRVEEDVLKEFKKWLIDNGYRSINQYLNEHIRNIVKKDKIKRRNKEVER